MHERHFQDFFVQITGAVEDIDQLHEHWAMEGARRCNLHGQAWIEMPSITETQGELAEINHCTVHFVHSSPYRLDNRERRPH